MGGFRSSAFLACHWENAANRLTVLNAGAGLRTGAVTWAAVGIATGEGAVVASWAGKGTVADAGALVTIGASAWAAAGVRAISVAESEGVPVCEGTKVDRHSW